MIVTAAWRYGAHTVGIEHAPFRYLWRQRLIAIFGLRDRLCIILNIQNLNWFMEMKKSVYFEQ